MKRMRVTLVHPCIGRRAGDSSYIRTWQMEPLPPALIAGLTPPDVEVRFYDDRMEAVPFDEPTDLVAISVETYTAKRAYQIASEYRRRGVPVVMGGFHASLCRPAGAGRRKNRDAALRPLFGDGGAASLRAGRGPRAGAGGQPALPDVRGPGATRARGGVRRRRLGIPSLSPAVPRARAAAGGRQAPGLVDFRVARRLSRNGAKIDRVYGFRRAPSGKDQPGDPVLHLQQAALVQETEGEPDRAAHPPRPPPPGASGAAGAPWPHLESACWPGPEWRASS